MSTPPLFYCAPAELAADELTLTGPEGHHAGRVRRLRVGEQVLLGDGDGALALARVRALTPAGPVLAVDRRWREDPPPWRLTVVQSLAAGGRDELAVAAMTEVGVDAVVPYQAQHSVARPGRHTLDRWRATAREAAKQARRARVPAVAEPAPLDRVRELVAGGAPALVLDREGATPVGTVAVAGPEVVLVVGPEGGLSEAELAACREAGAVPVRLGPHVLRSSTAGAAAAAVLLAVSGRWP